MKRLLLSLSLLATMAACSMAQGFIIDLTDGSHKVFNSLEGCRIEFYDRQQPLNNGHDYVDLGLKCSVAFATTNVGASRPTECGEYYAYGETQPKKLYRWDNYKWCNGGENYITKYKLGLDGKMELDPEDDVAKKEWGGEWRTPTREELDELRACSFTSQTVDGVKVYKITGPNGNSILVPMAGKFDETVSGSTPRFLNENAYLRSSSTTTAATGANAHMVYWSNYRSSGTKFYKYVGESVRPVIPLPTPGIKVTNASGKVLLDIPQSRVSRIRYINLDEREYCFGGHSCVDLGLPSGTKWATTNVGASTPEESGDYYAWGETKTKNVEYSLSHYDWARGTTYMKYNNSDQKTVLEPGDDAATVNWGSDWRTPTAAQAKELVDYCTFEFMYYQGSPCFKVTGPNARHIFLPVAGFKMDSVCKAGEAAEYMTSTRSPDGISSMIQCNVDILISTDPSLIPKLFDCGRAYGRTVRPVAAPANQ